MGVARSWGLTGTAYCMAHAGRKFDELVKAGVSVVTSRAIQRIARLNKRTRSRPILTS